MLKTLKAIYTFLYQLIAIALFSALLAMFIVGMAGLAKIVVLLLLFGWKVA
jgi:hypothetical protein